ncbi:unnamed protein product, partial [Mesorhabditis spiculigera]
MSTYMRIVFIAVLLATVAALVEEHKEEHETEESHLRAKRQYGYGGYGWGGDYWYTGRMWGILLGIILLSLCCCVPLVCLIGVWFMGWFGVRDRHDSRRKGVPTMTSTTVYPPPQSVIQLDEEPHTPPRTYTPTRQYNTTRTYSPAAPAQSEHIVYQSDERYYTTSGSPPRNSAI